MQISFRSPGMDSYRARALAFIHQTVQKYRSSLRMRVRSSRCLPSRDVTSYWPKRAKKTPNYESSSCWLFIKNRTETRRQFQNTTKMTRVKVLCDIKATIEIFKNGPSQKMRKINTWRHYVLDELENGTFEIEYVNSGRQQADVFTKPFCIRLNKKFVRFFSSGFLWRFLVVGFVSTFYFIFFVFNGI